MNANYLYMHYTLYFTTKKTIMEIYIKDEDGNLIKTSILSLLDKAFTKAGFRVDNDSWEMMGISWLTIIQENQHSSRVTTDIIFDSNGNKILGLHVYVSPREDILKLKNGEPII